MKRSISTWTTTLATATLLGLPGAAIAKPQQPSTPPEQQQPAPQPTQPQQPQPAPQPTQPPTEPQPTQPPTQPQPTQPQQPQPAPQPTQPQPTEPPSVQPTTPPNPTTSQPQASATATEQSVSPEEHLRQAREALNAINTTSIPARNRAQFTELRRHLAALDNPAAASSTSSKTAKGTASSTKADNWGTEVAAIDRIITNLAGSDTASGAAGTSTAGATGTTGSKTATVDEATRGKLMEIRTHITAYAAAKSGTSSPRSDAAMTPSNEAAASQPAAAAAATPATASAAGQTPTPAQTQPSNPAEGAATQATPQAAAAPKIDAEAAHRELLAARDALNQLTQLPAAAQLSGESRTQVQQLITNFNELITNTTDWRPSYAKVEGSLNAILGPGTSASAAEMTPAASTPATPANPANPATPANPAASATQGAVGTSGTTQLDPAIRAKLVEMRNHLSEFQKASGGAEK